MGGCRRCMDDMKAMLSLQNGLQLAAIWVYDKGVGGVGMGYAPGQRCPGLTREPARKPRGPEKPPKRILNRV